MIRNAILLLAAVLGPIEVADLKVEPVPAEGSPLYPYPTWDAWGPRPGAGFGSALASGDINADGYDDAVVASPGTAATYVYMGGPKGLALLPLTLKSPVSPQHAQWVRFAGDVDGDRFADVVVEFRELLDPHEPLKPARTTLYLYRGTKSGLTRQPYKIAQASSKDPESPRLAVAFDDFDKDGFADVVVASCLDRKLELRRGSKNGLREPAWKGAFPWREGEPGGARVANCTVAPLRERSGVKRSSLVLQATLCADSDGLECSTKLAILRPNEGSSFATEAIDIDLGVSPELALGAGEEIDGRFDVNADGYTDLLFTAPGVGMGDHETGSLYVLYGPVLERTKRVARIRVFRNTEYGGITMAAGDLDNDGYVDIVAGATSAQNIPTGHDRVLLIKGSSDGLSLSVAWSVRTPPSRFQEFGTSIAVGDFNGDNRPDLLVGAPGERFEFGAIPGPGYIIRREFRYGRVLVFMGSDPDHPKPPTTMIGAAPRPACLDVSARDCGFN